MPRRFFYTAAGVLTLLTLFTAYELTHGHKGAVPAKPEPEQTAMSAEHPVAAPEPPRTHYSSSVQIAGKKPEQAKAGEMLAKGLSYREQRHNVNFDDREFMAKLISTERDLFQRITDEFRDIDPLTTEIPKEEFYFQTKPKALLARMGLMDMLKYYCKNALSDSATLRSTQTLRDIIELSIPRTLPEHIKKILASEKYDALSDLAECDPEQALIAYESVRNPVLKNLLLGALNDGLSRSQPSEKLESIRQSLQKYSNNK